MADGTSARFAARAATGAGVEHHAAIAVERAAVAARITGIEAVAVCVESIATWVVRPGMHRRDDIVAIHAARISVAVFVDGR